MDKVKYNGNRKMKQKLVDNIDKKLKVEIKKNSDEWLKNRGGPECRNINYYIVAKVMDRSVWEGKMSVWQNKQEREENVIYENLSTY